MIADDLMVGRRFARFEWPGRMALAAVSVAIVLDVPAGVPMPWGFARWPALADAVTVAALWAAFWLFAAGRFRTRLAGIITAATAVGVALWPALSAIGARPRGGLALLPLVMAVAQLGWRPGLVAIGGVTVAAAGWDAAAGVSGQAVLADTVKVVLWGLTAVAARRGLDVAGELGRARAELADLAVAEERARIAGDVNGLLRERIEVVAVELERLDREASVETVDVQRVGARAVAEVARAAIRESRRAVDRYRFIPDES
jgi:two-component system sensor histidine kinase DesK